jgi:hypothetical protein
MHVDCSFKFGYLNFQEVHIGDLNIKFKMCWSFYAFHDLGGKPVGAWLAREWEGGGVLLGQVLYRPA